MNDYEIAILHILTCSKASEKNKISMVKILLEQWENTSTYLEENEWEIDKSREEVA